MRQTGRRVSTIHLVAALSLPFLMVGVGCRTTPTVIPPTFTPYHTATPWVRPPATRVMTVDYGVEIYPFDVDVPQLVSYVQDLGVPWVRIPVSWASLEPEPGAIQWNSHGLEDAVNALSESGINILFTVSGAPAWSRTLTEDDGPPDNPQDFGAFVRRLSTHYEGKVQAYEIWRNQNVRYGWNTGRPLNAREYVNLLCIAYSNIKYADPSAVVISGALVPTGWNDGLTAVDDVVYLTSMYEAGLAHCSDVVGAYAPGYNNPPDVAWQTHTDPTSLFPTKNERTWFFQGTIQAYRDVMLRFGEPYSTIWITGAGWASSEGIATVPPSGFGYAADNTEHEQAQFIVDAIELAESTGYIEGIVISNLNYGMVFGSSSGESLFGLLRPDGSRRPAFEALAGMLD